MGFRDVGRRAGGYSGQTYLAVGRGDGTEEEGRCFTGPQDGEGRRSLRPPPEDPGPRRVVSHTLRPPQKVDDPVLEGVG